MDQMEVKLLVIASVAWQSQEEQPEHVRLPRSFLARNDKVKGEKIAIKQNGSRLFRFVSRFSSMSNRGRP